MTDGLFEVAGRVASGTRLSLLSNVGEVAAGRLRDMGLVAADFSSRASWRFPRSRRWATW